jgi:DNA phosphorothioation-associated putative methyltransferase
MTATEFREAVARIPYGKELPTAKYIYWSPDADLPEGLSKLLSSLLAKLGIGPDFNVVKFSARDFAISFLSYPEFLGDPHPSLHQSVRVNLATGKILRLSYHGRLNPPILHRKETFLPEGHIMRPIFSVLTKAEEEAGLYESPSAIGFEENWRRLLEQKGLAHYGHELVRVPNAGQKQRISQRPIPKIARHRTAIVRDDLSKPVKLLLQYDLLKPPTFRI